MLGVNSYPLNIPELSPGQLLWLTSSISCTDTQNKLHSCIQYGNVSGIDSPNSLQWMFFVNCDSCIQYDNIWGIYSHNSLQCMLCTWVVSSTLFDSFYSGPFIVSCLDWPSSISCADTPELLHSVWQYTSGTDSHYTLYSEYWCNLVAF